jgi:apolipoprotein N-acyltransferase
MASIVGAYGLTWITLAIAAAPGLGVAARASRLAIGLAVATLIGVWGYGAWRLAGAKSGPTGVFIRVVQPNTPERAHYDADAFADVLRRNLDLTRKPAARPPDVVIWSEAGLPAALEDYLAPGAWTEKAIASALAPGEWLITGGVRAQPAPRGAYAPDGFIYHNSLLVLRRTGDGLAPAAVYDKYRLVPFGEFLPLDRFLAPLGVQQMIHVGEGFTPGPPPRPIRPPGLPPLQPLICYESLFPGFHARRRPGERRATAMDRQPLRRRVVRRDERALATSEPRELSRHRGRIAPGASDPDRRLGRHRRLWPRASRQADRRRRIWRDRRRAPAGVIAYHF